MRIDPAAAALQSQLLGMLKGQGEVKAPAFAPEVPSPAAPPAAATVTVPNASLAMLVAAAAASPASKPAVLRKAERGIDALGRLHRLLQSGAPIEAALDELADWREGAEVGEGEAGALLEEVEMRILVELAKAGR